MQRGSSEQVRAVASEKYVLPAIQAGKSHFSVSVKDLMQDLVTKGFPPANTPQVCSALEKKEFLARHGIEIEAIDGPPSKRSTTVIYRYRVTSQRSEETVERNPPDNNPSDGEKAAEREETPEEWAHRMTSKLRGLLKEELAEYGGGEAFLRWVRGYDEEDG